MALTRRTGGVGPRHPFGDARHGIPCLQGLRPTRHLARLPPGPFRLPGFARTAFFAGVASYRSSENASTSKVGRKGHDHSTRDQPNCRQVREARTSGCAAGSGSN